MPKEVKNKVNLLKANAPSGFSIFPGIYVVGVVIVLLSMKPILTAIHTPSHLNEIATECASSAVFCGLPTADFAGTRIAYCRNTDTGLGLFMDNLVTGQNTLVHEYKEGTTPPDSRRSCVLPWSPDDKEFAFTRNIGVMEQNKQEILVYHADTEEQETIPCEVIARGCTATSFFSWLTPDSFVYFDARSWLHKMSRRANGHWNDLIISKPPGGDDPPSFIATMAVNKIVWQQGNTIWSLNPESPDNPTKVFDLASNNTGATNITAVSHLTGSDSLLVSCQGPKASHLLSVRTDENNGVQEIKSSWSILNAVEINGGKGVAYMCQKRQLKELAVQADATIAPKRLFNQGQITGFLSSGNGKELFIVGIATNEFSAGIWKYDIDPDSLDCVVPGVDKPEFSSRSPAIDGQLVLPSGRKIAFNIFLPPRLDRHKKRKYPLIISGGYLVNEGPAFANCDIILAFALRKSWDDSDVSQWEEDTWELYKYLSKDIIVDKDRIYIAGVSRETIPLNDIVNKHPDSWRGVLLLSPVELPDLSMVGASHHMPKIVVSMGTDDNSLDKTQMKQYEEHASEMGIPMDVFIQAGAEHAFFSQKAKEARMCQLVDSVWKD